MYREVDEMPKCATCGILVPCQEVYARRHEIELIFCSERCVRIYDEYKFPKYRDEILAAQKDGSRDEAEDPE
jgi:hypothetical protein